MESTGSRREVGGVVWLAGGALETRAYGSRIIQRTERITQDVESVIFESPSDFVGETGSEKEQGSAVIYFKARSGPFYFSSETH